MSTAQPPSPSIAASRRTILTVLFLSLCLPLVYHTILPYANNIWTTATTSQLTKDPAAMSDSAQPQNSSRTPVYFMGIGGPNFFENTAHPVYAKMGALGREITTKVKPKAVVVFSAHWQGGPSSIQINTAEHVDQIYDFYGFPAHYYEAVFPSRGSPELAEKVISKLAATGVKVDRVKRGLDHGVWAGFIVAFDPEKNPLNVPIVQVSLYGNEDPDQHYRLGQALESLRDEGVLIVGAGMAVHNLRDFRARGPGKVMPYVATFDSALEAAAAAKPEERQAKLSALVKASGARDAHPTLEHILPMHVSAGAAGSDVGEQLWTLHEASISWASYRFGKVA